MFRITCKKLPSHSYHHPSAPDAGTGHTCHYLSSVSPIAPLTQPLLRRLTPIFWRQRKIPSLLQYLTPTKKLS
ncbi:MAG: hypothetical protein U5J82_10435 [Desulfobacterales bacterium]|nr:hypothetical protein [Desulfobacterales bacterium]